MAAAATRALAALVDTAAPTVARSAHLDVALDALTSARNTGSRCSTTDRTVHGDHRHLRSGPEGTGLGLLGQPCDELDGDAG